MDKILVDIREQNEDITDYFNNKDLVSVEELLNSIGDLLWEKNELENEIRNLENKDEEEIDPHDLWWDNQRGV